MRRPGFAALWLASLAAMLRDKGAALLLLGAPVLYGFFYPWFYAPQVVQRVPVALVVQVVRVNAGFFGQAQAAMAKALAGLPSPSA